MATRGMKVTLAVLALACWTRPAQAQDVGATASGTWETPTIWTSGSVPGSTNNVFIGSTFPTGAASTATVTLTANESAQSLYLGYGNGTSSGTLSLGSNTLTASGNVVLGQGGGTGTIAESGGSFTANALYIYSGNSYSFGAHDAVGLLVLDFGTATTAATGNVTGDMAVFAGSTLNMGAALNLSGNLMVQDSGSSVNAQGHGITSNQLFVGWNGSSAASLINAGPVTTNDLFVGNTTAASVLTLHGGDVINDSINLRGGSTLTVQQVGGTGLTFNGTSLSSLSIVSSSMDLIFTQNSPSSWDFRWQDPSGGNWKSTINTMITDGEIKITSPDGYQVTDHNGYTWIQNGAVPEPSSLLMLGLGSLGLLGVVAARRRSS